VDLTSPGASLTCPIYKGAGGCVRTDDRIVGTFTITNDSVNWSFSGHLASDFHLYAGKCQTNDAGNHLSDGVCDLSDMDQFARTPGRYSLVAGVDPGVEDFTFSISNQSSFRKQLWASYDLFPLGGAERRYLSAHSSVCECPGGDCPSAVKAITSESAVSSENSADASGSVSVDSAGFAKLATILSMIMAVAL
jgi:hypothetical protein